MAGEVDIIDKARDRALHHLVTIKVADEKFSGLKIAERKARGDMNCIIETNKD